MFVLMRLQSVLCSVTVNCFHPGTWNLTLRLSSQAMFTHICSRINLSLVPAEVRAVFLHQHYVLCWPWLKVISRKRFILAYSWGGWVLNGGGGTAIGGQRRPLREHTFSHRQEQIAKTGSGVRLSTPKAHPQFAKEGSRPWPLQTVPIAQDQCWNAWVYGEHCSFKPPHYVNLRHTNIKSITWAKD